MPDWVYLRRSGVACFATTIRFSHPHRKAASQISASVEALSICHRSTTSCSSEVLHAAPTRPRDTRALDSHSCWIDCHQSPQTSRASQSNGLLPSSTSFGSKELTDKGFGPREGSYTRHQLQIELGAPKLSAAHSRSPSRQNHRDCRSSQKARKETKTLHWILESIISGLGFKVSMFQRSIGVVWGQTLEEARGKEVTG